MREHTSFPRPEETVGQKICTHIRCELRKAGIDLQKISVDGNAITVTTDEKHLELVSSLQAWVEHKGFTIEFLTSG